MKTNVGSTRSPAVPMRAPDAMAPCIISTSNRFVANAASDAMRRDLSGVSANPAACAVHRGAIRHETVLSAWDRS